MHLTSVHTLSNVGWYALQEVKRTDPMPEVFGGTVLKTQSDILHSVPNRVFGSHVSVNSLPLRTCSESWASAFLTSLWCGQCCRLPTEGSRERGYGFDALASSCLFMIFPLPRWGWPVPSVPSSLPECPGTERPLSINWNPEVTTSPYWYSRTLSGTHTPAWPACGSSEYS